MKAITVKQPWASAILATKRVENRATRFAYRGPLLIHAGVSWCADGANDPRVWSAIGRPSPDLPAGVVLAVAELVDVHEAVEFPTLFSAAGTCCEPWGERVYSARRAKHLVLADVRPLRKPVEARGALGLWTPSPDLAAAVAAQLAKETA